MEQTPKIAFSHSLHNELIRLANIDRKAHDALWVWGDEKTRSAKKWIAVDEIYQKKLWDIVDKHGLPGKSLVGEDGAIAFWELLQATPDTKLHRKCVGLMEKAIQAKDFPAAPLKYLKARLCSTSEAFRSPLQSAHRQSS